MQKPTAEMIRAWKDTFEKYNDLLRPNQRSGQEIVDYLAAKYPLVPNKDRKAKDLVTYEILENKPLREKLSAGEQPNPIAFFVENEGAGAALYRDRDAIFEDSRIFVNVDLQTGYFHVEGSDFLWDELCAFRGLDAKDLKNYYCVASYIGCLKRFGMLEKVLDQA